MKLLSVFRLIYLLGAVNALFFSVLVFSKKSRRPADKILGIWLVILSAQITIPFLYLTNIKIYYQCYGIETAFYVFHPVLLYFYVLATIGKNPGLRIILWSLVPVIISEIAGLFFLFIPTEERVSFIVNNKCPPELAIPFTLFMLAYFCYFIYGSYKTLKNYKNNVLHVFSYREHVDLLWLRRLTLFFAGMSILIFPLGSISFYGFHSMIIPDYIFNILLVVFVFFLGYWGYHQGNVFSINDELNLQKIKGNHQSSSEVEFNMQLKQKVQDLEKFMQMAKPYLNPTLTLQDLAREMDIPPYQLSKIINKEIHSNFFEFINTYRVEEFKTKVFSSDYKNLTILAVALDCGFNSKSAFNRIFKEYTGITPGDFLKNHS